MYDCLIVSQKLLLEHEHDDPKLSVTNDAVLKSLAKKVIVIGTSHIYNLFSNT